MITVKTNQASTVKLNLNPSKLDSGLDIDIVFTSPTRPTITLTKSLNVIHSGFYSFEISIEEAEDFKDDTYSYQINQGLNVLKYGKAWVTTVDEVNMVFDYTLDFTLS